MSDRVVLKIGTSSLITGGRVDPRRVDRLCEAIQRGIAAGLSPVLVASGAIAVGRTANPSVARGDDAGQQVAAALGQGLLYPALRERFAASGLVTGQVLLTPHDLIEPGRGARVRTLFDEMHRQGFLPIVNENDALGVRNNDVLAALLAGFLRAELLLLLTNVPGLYDGNPLLGSSARRIGHVPALNAEFEAMAGDSLADGGTGGMRMKLAACWIATYSGVRTVIADTADPAVLIDAYRGVDVGTDFAPRPIIGKPPPVGRLWRAFRTPPRGTITCGPAGRLAIEARQPLRRVQITTARGRFRAGDVVDVTGPDQRLLARGGIRFAAETVEFGCAPDTALFVGSDYVRIGEDCS